MPETEKPSMREPNLDMTSEEFWQYGQANGFELTEDKVKGIEERIKSLDKNNPEERREIEFLLNKLQGAKKI